MSLKVQKNKIKVLKYEVMTYSYGNEGDDVLLLLHGGPGCPSDYLQDSHKQFSNHGYRVVTWDQLGCGASDKPNDTGVSGVYRDQEFI